MENIEIKSIKETPYFPTVEFNAANGHCTIAGESYMEETYKFYLPLITWFKEFIEKVKTPIKLDIKLIYLNTSSSKCILDILEILKIYQDNGGNVEINWYYDTEDPDMVEEVEDFEAEADLKINLIEMN